MIVVINDRLLPSRSPSRSAARSGMVLHRTGASAGATNASAADVTGLLEVVAVAVEVIHTCPERAGTHEVVHDCLFAKEGSRTASALIGIVAAYNAPPRDRVVRFANSGMKQKMH